MYKISGPYFAAFFSKALQNSLAVELTRSEKLQQYVQPEQFGHLSEIKWTYIFLQQARGGVDSVGDNVP